MANSVLTFKGQAVIIAESTEMGGAVDGYWLSDLNRRSLGHFDLPYTAGPETEWEALSDSGKEEVRLKGWSNFGRWEHAVALGLRELGVVAGSEAHKEYLQNLRSKVASIESEAREEFELALAQKSDSVKVERLIQKHKDAAAILSVAEDLHLYSPEGLKEEWSAWQLPTGE